MNPLLYQRARRRRPRRAILRRRTISSRRWGSPPRSSAASPRRRTFWPGCGAPSGTGSSKVESTHFGDVVESMRRVGTGRHPSPATNGGEHYLDKIPARRFAARRKDVDVHGQRQLTVHRSPRPLPRRMPRQSCHGTSRALGTRSRGICTITGAAAGVEPAGKPVCGRDRHLPAAAPVDRTIQGRFLQANRPRHSGRGVQQDFRNGEICLFPEILKSDLHPVRATIERASKIRRLDGEDKTQAAGIRLGGSWAITIAVQLRSGSQVGYTVNRWE